MLSFSAVKDIFSLQLITSRMEQSKRQLQEDFYMASENFLTLFQDKVSLEKLLCVVALLRLKHFNPSTTKASYPVSRYGTEHASRLDDAQHHRCTRHGGLLVSHKPPLYIVTHIIQHASTEKSESAISIPE